MLFHALSMQYADVSRVVAGQICYIHYFWFLIGRCSKSLSEFKTFKPLID